MSRRQAHGRVWFVSTHRAGTQGRREARSLRRGAGVRALGWTSPGRAAPGNPVAPVTQNTLHTVHRRPAPRFNGGGSRGGVSGGARPRRPAPRPSGQDTAAQERLPSSLALGGGPAGRRRLRPRLHTCCEHGGVPATGGPVSAWLVLVLVLAGVGRGRMFGQEGGGPVRPRRAGAGAGGQRLLAPLPTLLQEGVLVSDTCKHRAETGMSSAPPPPPGPAVLA